MSSYQVIFVLLIFSSWFWNKYLIQISVYNQQMPVQSMLTDLQGEENQEWYMIHVGSWYNHLYTQYIYIQVLRPAQQSQDKTCTYNWTQKQKVLGIWGMAEMKWRCVLVNALRVLLIMLMLRNLEVLYQEVFLQKEKTTIYLFRKMTARTYCHVLPFKPVIIIKQPCN